MKRRVLVVLGAVGLFGAAVPRVAAAETKAIYDEAAKAGRMPEVEAVDKACSYSIMSRLGPTPKQVAACDAAVAKVVAKGPAAFPAIFAFLDQTHHGAARQRLYDVLAKSGDLTLVEPLVTGLARIGTRSLGDRTWEAEYIQEALAELTRAPVGAPPRPWETETELDPVEAVKRRALAWRTWQRSNEGKTHDELVAARKAEALRQAAEPDAGVAFDGVVYLCEYEPEEGVRLGQAYGERSNLPENAAQAVRWRVEQAQWRLQEQRARAAKGKPAKPVRAVPPAPVPPPPSKAPDVPRS